MPRFDGTGPIGQGPFSGRGMGYCVAPVRRLASAPRPAAPAAIRYRPSGTHRRGGAPYKFVGIRGPHFGRDPWLAYGSGFGRRGLFGRWW